MVRNQFLLTAIFLGGAVLAGCRDKVTDTAEGNVTDTMPGDEDWSLSVSGPDEGTAGDDLTWEAVVQNESGEDLDATLSMFIVDDGGAVHVDDTTLSWTPTESGNYTVTVSADYDGEILSEELSLTISPDALSGLVLTLSSESADIGDTITATVTGTDDWGNAIDVGDASLSAAPSDGVSFTGTDATFSADGTYIFTAEAEGMTATAGPVLVDGSGPLVVLSSPARGAWIEGDSVTVEGVVEDAVSDIYRLYLNEEAVTLAEDGSFSHDIDLIAGPNLLSFAAEDSDGNASDSIVGVIAGSFSSDTIDGGIDVHLNQGALDAISASLVDAFDIDAIESDLIASNPVAQESLGCVDVDVDVTGLSLDTPVAEVSPTSEGLILTITAADLDIDLDIDVDLCGWSSSSTDGELSADEVEIEVEISIEVSGPGDVDVTVESTTVTFTNFDEDFGTLSSILSTFGYSLSDLGIDTEGIVEDALVDAIEDAVPGTLEDALESVSISETLGILDTEAELSAEIGELETSGDGLTLMLDVDVTNEGTHEDIPSHPGSLMLSGDAPDSASEPGLFLGLSLDTLNRILEKLWDAGGVNTVITSSELGLEAALVELVFPGNTALTLRLYPQLPPVLTPVDGDQPLSLDIAEIQVEIWGDSDTSAPLTIAAIHLTAGTTPTLNVPGPGEAEIALEVEEATLLLDIISENAADVGDDESLEGLLALATGGLAESLLPEISFALPAMGGFTLEPESIEAAGDNSDWIVVAAELSRE